MKALFLSGLALAVAAGIALPLAGAAEAAIGGARPSTEILPIEKAQFFFNDQNYCWYDSGWQGPGWYWCGYAWNNGQGWGGGEGWHGWSRGSHAAAPRAPSHVAPSIHFGGHLGGAHGGASHGHFTGGHGATGHGGKGAKKP